MKSCNRKAFVLRIQAESDEFIIEIDSNDKSTIEFTKEDNSLSGHFGCPTCLQKISIKVNKCSNEKEVAVIILLPSDVKTEDRSNPVVETSPIKVEEKQGEESNPLETNKREKLSTEDLTCKECGKTFGALVSLRLHKNTHTDKFRCTIQSCRKGFPNNSRLRLHLRSIHKILDGEVVAEDAVELKRSTNKPIICEVCGRHYSSNTAYFIHKQNHKPPQFECHFCGKRVFRKSILKKHLITQHMKHQTLEYKCPVCAKEFYHKYSLIAHHHVHQEPRHACRFCYAKFKQSSALKTHEKIHTGEKKFSCGTCPANFSTKCALKCHETVHTNKKNFKCGSCDKRFSRRSYLTAHERIHRKTEVAPKGMLEEKRPGASMVESVEDNFYFNLLK